MCFRRVGAYALPMLSDDPVSARPVAGLTQQALKDNAVLSVTDVPPEYFSISSALGAGAFADRAASTSSTSAGNGDEGRWAGGAGGEPG